MQHVDQHAVVVLGIPDAQQTENLQRPLTRREACDQVGQVQRMLHGETHFARMAPLDLGDAGLDAGQQFLRIAHPHHPEGRQQVAQQAQHHHRPEAPPPPKLPPPPRKPPKPPLPKPPPPNPPRPKPPPRPPPPNPPKPPKPPPPRRPPPPSLMALVSSANSPASRPPTMAKPSTC